jgi:hypothetical protein
MPWPLPQPRYVQAPDETPELSAGVTPDTPAGGMNAKALPMPSGRNLWFQFADTGNDLATSTTVTGTVEASSESYTEAAGALRVTGTAEANTESYASASGALRLTGTAEGSPESYVEATGTVSTAVVAEEDRYAPLTLWPVVQPNRVWFPDDTPQFSTTITGTVEASTESYADAGAGMLVVGVVDGDSESYAELEFVQPVVVRPGGGAGDGGRGRKKKPRELTQREQANLLGLYSEDAIAAWLGTQKPPAPLPSTVLTWAVAFLDED